MMNQVNSFLSALKRAYSQQGQLGRILLPAVILMVICCLCVALISLFPRRSPANVAPSPDIFPTGGTQATPTALFDFDFATFTPFPTLTVSIPSAFPTLTPAPTEIPTLTESPTPTQIAPTASQTVTPIPTDTNTATQVPPTVTATATKVISLVILDVHKVAENVDIQNVSSETIDLSGWRLVSENGNQSCNLSGTLRPGRGLKIWANRGPGFDCGLPNETWLDNELDPAVLYNPQGEEVSRFP